MEVLVQLFKYVVAGDLGAVRQWLDEHDYLIHVRNPDADAWDEQTLLHVAAKYGHCDIVRLLVERGAEVYSNPMASYPPVIVAAWNDRPEVVEYFLQCIPMLAHGTNNLGVTANLAARQGWADIVRAHIEADPLSVHQRGWIGDTPLHWPAHNGFVEILEVLIEAGADIEADETNCYGGKPLHWASESKPNAVQCLIGRGAKVDSRNVLGDSDFHGATPLIMNACQRDDCSEVTTLLLEAGADINAQDAKGKTALARAMENNLERIPDVLRQYGATI